MIKEFTNYLMPEYLFTRAVFFTTFLWVLTVHLTDSLNNRSESYILRVGLVLLVHLALYGFWWIAKKTLLDFLKPSLVPIIFTIFIVFGGALRGVLFHYLLNYYDISIDTSATQRALNSAWNTTLVTVIATLAVAHLHANRSLRTRLLLEASRLEFAKESSKMVLEDVSVEQSQIKAELLRSVTAMKKSALPQILTNIKTIIDEIVRPLSRALDEKQIAWNPPHIEPRSHRVEFKAALQQSATVGQINYLFVPSVMVLLTLPAILTRTSTFTAFFVFPITILVASILVYLLTRIFVSRWNTYFSYIALTIAGGAIYGSSTLLYTSNFKEPSSLFRLGIIFYTVWSLALSFLKTLSRLNLEANKKLNEISNDLAWQVANLRKSGFSNRRRLAAVIHGQIQAKFASTYLQLNSIGEQGLEERKRVDSLLDGLENAINDIDSKLRDTHDLNLMFQKVVETWAGVTQIQMLAGPAIMAQIHRDQVCTAALTDLIPEVCFNSIKHGKATQILVDLNFKSDRVLELIVSNDGVLEESHLGMGLGSKLLNEISVFWESKNEVGRIVTRVEVAYRAT